MSHEFRSLRPSEPPLPPPPSRGTREISESGMRPVADRHPANQQVETGNTGANTVVDSETIEKLREKEKRWHDESEEDKRRWAEYARSKEDTKVVSRREIDRSLAGVPKSHDYGDRLYEIYQSPEPMPEPPLAPLDVHLSSTDDEPVEIFARHEDAQELTIPRVAAPKPKVIPGFAETQERLRKNRPQVEALPPLPWQSASTPIPRPSETQPVRGPLPHFPRELNEPWRREMEARRRAEQAAKELQMAEELAKAAEERARALRYRELALASDEESIQRYINVYGKPPKGYDKYLQRKRELELEKAEYLQIDDADIQLVEDDEPTKVMKKPLKNEREQEMLRQVSQDLRDALHGPPIAPQPPVRKFELPSRSRDALPPLHPRTSLRPDTAADRAA